MKPADHPANIMSKKEFIIVQTFNDGRPMTLDSFTRERGATWTFGYFGAKTYTLAGAERIATQVINKHDLQRSMLPDSKGVSFMKLGSEKFNQLFGPGASELSALAAKVNDNPLPLEPDPPLAPCPALDVMTERFTAFHRFADLLEAEGGYSPSLVTSADSARLMFAEIYDFCQSLRGDSRRVFRS